MSRRLTLSRSPISKLPSSPPPLAQATMLLLPLLLCHPLAGCGPAGRQQLDAQSPSDGQVAGDSSAQQDAGGDDASPPDASVTPCQGEVVARHDTAEIVLHSSTVYSGASGTPNPFVDVTVSATLTAPDGSIHQVDGFYDGDGAGGADGDVFLLRFPVAQVGQYTWTVQSSDTSLDGQTGQICGEGLLAGTFAAGPIRINPAHPHTFMYGDGSQIYLLGKFLDVAAPDPIRFSHTMFSELLSDTDRQAMLDRHIAMGLSKINVYLANRGDYGGVSTTPWLGSAGSNDKSRFDLGRWHSYDHWTRLLRDAGLAAQLWFFADDSGFGDLPDGDRQRLIRYGMARLSGYVNTLFTLCLEWQEGWSAAEVDSHAVVIQQHNPWSRPVSVHGTTGDFSFAGATWADYMDIQSGNNASHATVHAMGITNRALADKPLINEEFGLGDEDGVHRRRAWAAFTAGGAGSGTGAYLAHLSTFVRSVPFERMEPSDHLVVSGSAYCLAEPGFEYVAYLYDGGSVDLDLGAASGILQVTWFDPRSGTSSPAGIVTGGTTQSFVAPSSDDWVLHVAPP